MACWPTTAEWKAFNKTVGGALRATVPWAKPCFQGNAYNTPFNADQCAYIEANYADNPIIGPQGQPCGPARERQYGSFSQLNWEVCGASECLLQSAAPQVVQPLIRQCGLGRMSAYYVNATRPDQVQSTIAFCKSHKIFMSIKGTGDDYLGRSSSANSLALWTWNMKKLEYIENWTASSCPAANYKNVRTPSKGPQPLRCKSDDSLGRYHGRRYRCQRSRRVLHSKRHADHGWRRSVRRSRWWLWYGRWAWR